MLPEHQNILGFFAYTYCISRCNFCGSKQLQTRAGGVR
jgi:hypothetical protein